MRRNPTAARLLAVMFTVIIAGALLLTGYTGASAPADAHLKMNVETALAPAALSSTPLPRTGWTVTASD